MCTCEPYKCVCGSQRHRDGGGDVHVTVEDEDPLVYINISSMSGMKVDINDVTVTSSLLENIESDFAKNDTFLHHTTELFEIGCALHGTTLHGVANKHNVFGIVVSAL